MDREMDQCLVVRVRQQWTISILILVVLVPVVLYDGKRAQAQERLQLWKEGGDNIPAEYLEQLSDTLTDFEANVALLGDHIVDCQGWLRRTEFRNLDRSMEVPFHFVGVVDQSKARVRWICRRESTDGHTGEFVDREYEIIDSGAGFDCWANGVNGNLYVGDDDRIKKLRERNSQVVKFHPIPLSTVGASGTYGPYDRNVIQLQIPKNEHVSRIKTIGGELTAEWHIPASGDNFVRKEIVFDQKYGGMPISARVWMLLLDQDVEFLLHETITDWKPGSGGVWVPSKMNMTTYAGGEKNPSRIYELVVEIDWRSDLQRASLASAFELVAEDANRPRWTKELGELLGEPQRMSLGSLPRN